jgi:FkbM family methyltransferase
VDAGSLKRAVNRSLRLLAVRAGPVYLRARPLENLLRYLAKRPHEKEFAFFARFRDEPGLFLDVGANSGTSAISFRIFQRGCTILSIEPNPAHDRDLRLLKRFLRGFDYKICGASDKTGSAVLYVPTYRGTPLTPLATFDRENVTAPWRLEILLGAGVVPSDIDLAEELVPIRRLDELALEPRFVKIDVEGHELRVLHGLTETIRRARPLILIEWSRSFDQIEVFFDDFGYRTYVFDAQRQSLEPLTEANRGLNVFCLPDGWLRG